MTEGPNIELLSYKRRKTLFLTLVVVFLVALPSLIFYTTGYRLDFSNEGNTIVTTGGLYITTGDLEVEVFLDEVKVDRPRLFRSAYYIQNIPAGQHRLVVQKEGLRTWVKELPVDPYLVVEASSFNVPQVPQVRPITRYITATGTPVYRGVASTTELLQGVSTTVPILFAPIGNISSYQANQEFVYVQSLFGTTTTDKISVFSEWVQNTKERFGFATTTTVQATTSTTTSFFVTKRNMMLIEREADLYALWTGSSSVVPHYFCVADAPTTTIALRYGEHVANMVTLQRSSTSSPLVVAGSRICRTEIRIDRQWQDVYFYDFFPGSSDLVLLQLEDGLYVTEIDDRAWQNNQLLYPGNDFLVTVVNDTIYIKRGDYYFELLTAVEEE